MRAVHTKPNETLTSAYRSERSIFPAITNMSDVLTLHNEETGIVLDGISLIHVESPEPPTLKTDVNPEGVNEFAESQYAEKARKVIRVTNNLREMGYVNSLLVAVARMREWY